MRHAYENFMHKRLSCNIDALTGLYNRFGFYHALEHILEQTPAHPYVLICSNIGNFKSINELYGQETGDELLINLAQGIRNTASHFIAYGRLDADRFIFCVDAKKFNVDQLTEYNERMFSNAHISFTYRMRYGVYYINNTGLSANAMCDRAKAAKKYIQDEFYKPYAVWTESMLEEIVNTNLITNGLEQALTNNEFVVYYQPVVDVKTKKIAGAESLVRWNHPTLGFIGPDKFVPIFEKNASISKVDYYVGSTVCNLIKKQMATNLPVIPISVNISRVDFHHEELVDEVTALLKSHAFPKYCYMEITESAYAIEPEKITGHVQRLREYGVKALLDDFGSGLSSLNSLQEINVDYLKIDMKFLSGVQHNKKSRIVLSSIINMAHKLDLKVVAEGVETREEYEFLKDTDCDYIQGYYFYKPMPESDFIACLSGQENLSSFCRKEYY